MYQNAAVGVGQNWSKRDHAAILFATDEMQPETQRKRTDTSIAHEVGVVRQTITNWKRDSEFRAMIQDARGKIIADALRLPSAQKHQRIRNLHNIADGILQVISLRGERHAAELHDSPESAMIAVFGTTTPSEAATGLLVAQPKISASGRVVTEWAFDSAIVGKLESIYKHIAQELGQWEETINVNSSQYQNEDLDELSVDALRQIKGIMAREGRS